jgi:hypothetical protein
MTTGRINQITILDRAVRKPPSLDKNKGSFMSRKQKLSCSSGFADESVFPRLVPVITHSQLVLSIERKSEKAQTRFKCLGLWSKLSELRLNNNLIQTVLANFLISNNITRILIQ